MYEAKCVEGLRADCYVDGVVELIDACIGKERLAVLGAGLLCFFCGAASCGENCNSKEVACPSPDHIRFLVVKNV